MKYVTEMKRWTMKKSLSHNNNKSEVKVKEEEERKGRKKIISYDGYLC